MICKLICKIIVHCLYSAYSAYCSLCAFIARPPPSSCGQVSPPKEARQQGPGTLGQDWGAVVCPCDTRRLGAAPRRRNHALGAGNMHLCSASWTLAAPPALAAALPGPAEARDRDWGGAIIKERGEREGMRECKKDSAEGKCICMQPACRRSIKTGFILWYSDHEDSDSFSAKIEEIIKWLTWFYGTMCHIIVLMYLVVLFNYLNELEHSCQGGKIMQMKEYKQESILQNFT